MPCLPLLFTVTSLDHSFHRPGVYSHLLEVRGFLTRAHSFGSL
jgi:hypothetical protein